MHTVLTKFKAPKSMQFLYALKKYLKRDKEFKSKCFQQLSKMFFVTFTVGVIGFWE